MTPPPDRPVAVLGAGIMGTTTALELASRGRRVVLFDEAAAPVSGASRWNEGKIHLGFLYAADGSLDTARAVLEGGLHFADRMRHFLSCDELPGAVTPEDDVYLVHRDSVVDVDAIRRYFGDVMRLAQSHPGADRYLCDLRGAGVREVEAAELPTLANPAIVTGGFRVPERSVRTDVLADALVDAVGAHSSIDAVLGRRVTGATPTDTTELAWNVRTGDEVHGPFSAVVNALWAGRPAIDDDVGFRPDTGHRHRYRVSLFVRTDGRLALPSAVLAAGPFGDVKNYGDGNHYLSWYPDGLLADAPAIGAPDRPVLDDAGRTDIADRTFTHLNDALPWVAQIRDAAVDVRVEGGWVYSQGRGSLADPHAKVHRRDRLGIASRGSWHSVDTGKYSSAPLLAVELADRIVT